MEFLYKGSKIEAATPGLSLTPINVTLASFVVKETPLIILLLDIFFFFVIMDPQTFLKADRTSISILLSLASCIE